MNPRDKTIALLGGLALVLLVITFIGYAALSGRSVESVLPTILGFATPTIISLFAAAGARVDMTRLQTKVNGNYDELAGRNEDMAAQLASVIGQFHTSTGSMPVITPEQTGRHRAPGEQP